MARHNRLPFQNLSKFAFTLCVAVVFIPESAWAQEETDTLFFGHAVALDGENNVYVAGSRCWNETRVFALEKYSQEGDVVWRRTLEWPFGSLAAFHVTSEGTLTLVGTTTPIPDEASSASYLTARFDRLGALAWSRQEEAGGRGRFFNLIRSTPESTNDCLGTWVSAQGAVVDESGSVYVTGGGATDGLTVKYDSLGNRKWSLGLAGESILLDDEGHVILGVDGPGAYELVWLNSLGREVQRGTFGFFRNRGSFETIVPRPSLVAGPETNLLVADEERYVVFDSAGAVVHSAELPSSHYEPHLLAASPQHEAFLLVSVTQQDAIVAKLDSSGAVMRQTNVNLPPDVVDLRFTGDFRADAAGNAYFTGAACWTEHVVCGSVIFKVDHEGTLAWLWLDPDPVQSIAIGLAVDDEGSVYVTGTSKTLKLGPEEQERWRVSYPEPRRVANEPSVPLSSYRLSVYPNPSEGAVTVRYTLAEPGEVGVVIYDLLGKEVARLAATHKPIGYYREVWSPKNLPGGVYAIRLLVNGRAQDTKQVVRLQRQRR